MWSHHVPLCTCTASHDVDQSLDPGLRQSVPLSMEESPEMFECVVWRYMHPYCPPHLIPQMLNGIQIRWACQPLHHIKLVLLEVSCCNPSNMWTWMVLWKYGIWAHLGPRQSSNTGCIKKKGAKHIAWHYTSQCTYYEVQFTYYEVQLSIVHLIIKS